MTRAVGTIADRPLREHRDFVDEYRDRVLPIVEHFREGTVPEDEIQIEIHLSINVDDDVMERWRRLQREYLDR